MSKKGSVFVMAIAGSLVMMLTVVAVSNMLLRDAHMMRHLRRSVQARYLAEAGINAELPALFDQATAAGLAAFGPTASTALGDGSYTTELVQTGARWLLSAEGTVNGVVQEAAVEVTELFPEVLRMALATGADIDIRSVQGDVVINGNIHANGNMRLSEQGQPTQINVMAVNAEITGTATCSGPSYQIMGNVNIADAANSGPNMPPLAMLVFDWGFFRDVAQFGGGNYINGDTTFDSGAGTGNINGGAAGLTFVDGDARFIGACNITGGFVAAGSIRMNNGNSVNQTHDAGNRFPIFMSNGARMRLYGNFNTVQGNLVFATNDIDIRTPGGGASVLGCVIAGGDMDVVANDDLQLDFFQVLSPEFIPEGLEIVSWNR